ncbi:MULTISPECIES: YwaF family protein [Terrabacteria group]|uniref:TMEM164 family acyltransferase n=1 Tax=Bacillati TaxID=1783272 RepID=UPI001C6E0B62|nr:MULTISPECIES: YwaF family protein [Terrabacteria group]MBW9212155.1 YwaF family protein [Trueperella sp. zg.1013]
MMEFLMKCWGMFVAPRGTYEAAGMFSWGHWLLLAMTIIGVTIALKKTLQLPYKQIENIIHNLIVLLTILEIIKIYFNFRIGNATILTAWVPMYYCTICIYAGWLMIYGQGTWKYCGEVFLATGSLVGGSCFLLYPSSSLLLYPALHFLCVHSFFYHGCMVYIGILMNRSGYFKIQKQDFDLYALYVSAFCVVSWILNIFLDTNFMFISTPFEGTFLETLFNVLGPAYTLLLIIVQVTAPFWLVRWIQKKTSLLSRPAWYPDISLRLEEEKKVVPINLPKHIG